MAVAQSQAPGLTGTWQYDDTATQRLRSEERPERMRGPGGFPGGRPGGFPGGRPGGGPGGFGDRGRFEQIRERMQRIRQLIEASPERIEIAADTSSLTEYYGSQRTLALKTDGQEVKEQVDGVGDVKIKAKRKKDQVVVETKLDGGGKVVETYKAAGPERLTVTVKVEDTGMRRSPEFTRVYDRHAAGQS